MKYLLLRWKTTVDTDYSAGFYHHFFSVRKNRSFLKRLLIMLYLWSVVRYSGIYFSLKGLKFIRVRNKHEMGLRPSIFKLQVYTSGFASQVFVGLKQTYSGCTDRMYLAFIVSSNLYTLMSMKTWIILLFLALSMRFFFVDFFGIFEFSLGCWHTFVFLVLRFCRAKIWSENQNWQL